jgi:hypothetical protein
MSAKLTGRWWMVAIAAMCVGCTAVGGGGYGAPPTAETAPRYINPGPSPGSTDSRTP